MNTTQKDQEIHKVWRKYEDFYPISGGILFVLFGIWIGSLFFRDGFNTNLYTEGMGVLVTVLVLDRVNQWRDKQALKQQLIIQMGSHSNGQSVSASYELRVRGWLKDGSVSHASLRWADLSGARLWNAKLHNVDLYHANLSEARLRGADLSRSNLASVNFYKTRLNDVSLEMANLVDSNIYEAEFPEDSITRLPDGKTYTPKIDLRRYTDPQHPDFWQPDWAKIPLQQTEFVNGPKKHYT